MIDATRSRRAAALDPSNILMSHTVDSLGFYTKKLADLVV